jgi:hypothetical protein
MEKNKLCILSRWSHTFNSIIEFSGLKEVNLIGRNYTWTNNLPEPTFEKLESVLVSMEWDLAGKQRYFWSCAFNVEIWVPPPHYNSFRYENCWAERGGFMEIVEKSWNTSTFHKFDIDKMARES